MISPKNLKSLADMKPYVKNIYKSDRQWHLAQSKNDSKNKIMIRQNKELNSSSKGTA